MSDESNVNENPGLEEQPARPELTEPEREPEEPGREVPGETAPGGSAPASGENGVSVEDVEWDVKRLGRKLGCNTFFTVIVALMFFGFAGYQIGRPGTGPADYGPDIAALRSDLAGVSDAVSAAKGELREELKNGLGSKPDASALAEARRSAEERMDALEEEIGSLKRELAGLNAKLGESKPAEKIGYVIMDVRHLLTLANRKAVIDSDFVTAAALLREADEAVAATGDPRARALREKIAADLNALGNLPDIDVEKTLLHINELIGNVRNMRIKGLEKITVAGENEEVTGDVKDWWSNLTGSFNAFVNRFLVIKRKDVQDAALIAPDNEAFLRANLENYLLLAAKAYFYRQSDLYAQYLGRAEELTARYFDESDPVVANTLGGIREVAGAPVPLQGVKYLESLVEVRNFIRDFADERVMP